MKKVIVRFITINLFVALLASILLLSATSWAQVQPPGKPFQDFQAQIDDLQAQIDSLVIDKGGSDIKVHYGSAHIYGPIILRSGGAAEFLLPRDGIIQNVRISTSSNSYNGPAVVTFFVNGIPSLISTTITAGSTADIALFDTIDVFDGDRLSVWMDTSSVSSGFITLSVSYEIL